MHVLLWNSFNPDDFGASYTYLPVRGWDHVEKSQYNWHLIWDIHAPIGADTQTISVVSGAKFQCAVPFPWQPLDGSEEITKNTLQFDIWRVRSERMDVLESKQGKDLAVSSAAWVQIVNTSNQTVTPSSTGLLNCLLPLFSAVFLRDSLLSA